MCQQRHVRGRREAKKHGERHDARGCGAGGNRQPQTQNPDPREITHGHKDVVGAELVAGEPGRQSAEQRRRVEDGQEVLREVWGDSGLEGLERQVVDGYEKPVAEAKGAGRDEEEIHFRKGFPELRGAHLVWVRRLKRSDCQVGHHQQEQHEEGRDSHGPSEADLADEM